ncbi:MAG TPA: alpha/beta hydrolase [Solirubrobacteraceae bacterium]|jgi:pimeloyl-ACP methyl ester carboxylesterase
MSIDRDGRRLSCRTLGDGPPLLLVNGYAASSADWDPTLLSCLQRSFTVVCPDNRGIGGSELADPSELTIDSMAADMSALLDDLGFDRLPVAGWSMGGFVAQALAAREPERVGALVVLSSHPGGSGSVRAPAEVWRALTDHSGTPREQASRLIALLFPPAVAPQMDRDFGELVAAARRELRFDTLSAQEAAIQAWYATEPPAADIGAPSVLAVAGSEDVVVPPGNLQVLAARWPDCRTELFDRGGHAFMAQEPERVAALIEEFAL